MGYPIVHVEDVEPAGPAATRVPIAGRDGVTIVGSGARHGSYEPRGPF